ncbi:MAG TPA: dihydrofolate reductase family protein, partial [Chryseolinea sp.]|nr:dihydrofolate reductase family protein [Chryseolinea sp.]
EELNNISLIRIDEENFLTHLVHDLYKQKIQSVTIEGGAQTLQRFIDAGLWDEARIFVSPQTFQDGIRAPEFSGALESQVLVKNDLLKIYHPGKCKPNDKLQKNF